MRKVLLDKIASATRGCGVKREARVGAEIPCEEGVVIAVRVLTDKAAYDQLELPSGRMARLQSGDVIAGVLGHRNALFGYSGHLPETCQPGDRINILNLGGVLGVCDSVNPDLGPAFECEVLGSILHFPVLGERIGVPARVGRAKVDPDAKIDVNGIPLVVMVGTCMSAGKTAAACVLVREFVRAGKTVDAFKATGVSLRRDLLAMEDAGARHTALFTELGIVATTEKNGAAITRQLATQLAAGRPDMIVVELGDGLLGAYGVQAILADDSIRSAFRSVVLAANDPVAAWGGAQILRDEYGIDPVAITGPATDNLAGTRAIEARLGVRAINARTHGAELARHVLERIDGGNE